MSEIYTYYWHDTKTTTQCHKNTCSTIGKVLEQCSCSGEPAGRKEVSVKVSCSRESAHVEHTRTYILLNDVCVLVSLVFYFCDDCGIRWFTVRIG